MRTIPYVEEGNSRVDLPSRLLKDNIILVSGVVDVDMSDLVVSQLLYLSSVDPKKPIELYINSPGGSIIAGMAIFDTMKMIKNPINTTCIGSACSMGAFLLMAGKEAGGKRYMTPNAELMIHQPLGGTGDGSVQSTDFDIASRHLARTTLRMLALKARFTGKTLEEIIDASKRDNYMTAEEALEFGAIDEILYPEGESELMLPKLPALNITTDDGLDNLIKLGLLDEYVKQLGIKIK